jgi:hypothetical protein
VDTGGSRLRPDAGDRGAIDSGRLRSNRGLPSTVGKVTMELVAINAARLAGTLPCQSLFQNLQSVASRSR